MKSKLLIEKAEVHEGVSRALRNALAHRETPRTPRQQANADKLFKIARDAEATAAKLRTVAEILEKRR